MCIGVVLVGVVSYLEPSGASGRCCGDVLLGVRDSDRDKG